MKYDSDIYVVGDLHGNLHAYYENLRFFDIIDDNGNWQGGDSKLIFLGDILADRHENGFQILNQIEKLKHQARKCGGDVVLIFGNHDYKFILFVCTDISFNMYKTSFSGLLELRKFAGEGYRNENDFEKLRKDQINIQKNIINKQSGKELLKTIFEMKLVHRENDILFIHTNPTYEILQNIYEESLEKINEDFQKGVSKLFCKNYDNNDQEVSRFFELAIMYLILNRRESIPEYEKGGIYDALHSLGINYIINGHNGYGGTVDKRGKINIIDIDYSFGKFEGIAETQRSVALIKKDGQIYLGSKSIKI
ncbi:metallophosphoesterase [Candidatus Absconditicoccus praedator]|uniref:metallophosphoesterase n=1 Tax=Candidatus Absconditicoccus praedator TaxID=2735562 RepID=UPI001E513FA0|nr:metallophosphoesterase [Candidatus Absconditicoccus praedator]UFX82927.1 metallophosphoesterase [Candidatus Absconditicoccus praedator]